MFWDFMTSRPETTHQLLRIFSDLGTPDGFRRMNGFGANTFKMVNANGKAVYVKFHYLVSSTPSLFPGFFLLKDIVYIFKRAVQFYWFFELKTIVIQTRCTRWQFFQIISLSGVMLGKSKPRLVQYVLSIP
jgi:hypothetical protein